MLNMFNIMKRWPNHVKLPRFPVHPDLVEGLICNFSWFDKLTTNGRGPFTLKSNAPFV